MSRLADELDDLHDRLGRTLTSEDDATIRRAVAALRAIAESGDVGPDASDRCSWCGRKKHMPNCPARHWCEREETAYEEDGFHKMAAACRIAAAALRYAEACSRFVHGERPSEGVMRTALDARTALLRACEEASR